MVEDKGVLVTFLIRRNERAIFSFFSSFTFQQLHFSDTFPEWEGKMGQKLSLFVLCKQTNNVILGWCIMLMKKAQFYFCGAGGDS